MTLEQLRAAAGRRARAAARRATPSTPSRTRTAIRAASPRPSRKVELWSETFLDHGYAPLPDFVEPPIGPVARPDLAARFPLVLTCAKPTLFCQTQHRALPSLRKRAPDPEVELHPDAAARARHRRRGLGARSKRRRAACARARISTRDLDPRVVVGEHGWWQGCAELGAPGYDPFSPEGANFNLTVDRRRARSDQRHGLAPRQSVRGAAGAGDLTTDLITYLITTTSMSDARQLLEMPHL